MIILWLNKLYQHLEDYVSHNMIPNLLQNSKDNQDWNHFMILDAFSDLT